jgi:hypothetical protein
MAFQSRSGTYQEDPPAVFSQGLFEESSTKRQRLGTIRPLDDGRVFAYALAGEALASGLLTQGAVADTLAVEKVVATAATVGDSSLSLTYGVGTTAVADYFADGYVISAKVAVYPGPMYKIRGHAAATSSGTLKLELYDKIREALPITCYVDCIRNPQAGVLTAIATTPTAMLTGVPPIDVQSGYYFWNQVKGICSLAHTGTEVVGLPVAGSATAGHVMPYATIGSDKPAGVCALAGVTSTWHTFVMLSIPGY